MDLYDNRLVQLCVCPWEEFSSSSEPALCMKCEQEAAGERSITMPISVEPQHEWESLGILWFNTSVSLGAVPAFHDSAFHHLKHVIAFDDNRRIVARELSAVSKNTQPPASQDQST